MATLSACLVVHHEQHRIEGCLESIAGIADEIVVVHDGPCADRSLEIARRYTGNVVSTDVRAGSAEFLRPFALERCTQEWVLVIDADERLSPALRGALPGLLENDAVDAYGFAWPYVDAAGRRATGSSVSAKRFLFRRAQMYSVGLPHMPTDTYGTSVGMPLEVRHLLPERGTGLFSGLVRKNRRRGRAAAARLLRGVDSIAVFNASLADGRVKNTRKIRLLARHPLLALLTVPSYGFIYWYFAKGHYRAGRVGLHDALNLPIYYAYFALGMLRRRSGRTGEARG